MYRFVSTAVPLMAFSDAMAQTTPPVADLGGGIFQLLFGLAVVLALLVGTLWLLKRLTTQRGPGAGLLRVVAGTAVGARERVVIVEAAGSWLILGVAPGRVTALAEIPRQTLPEAESAPSATPDFPEWLRRLTSKK